MSKRDCLESKKKKSSQIKKIGMEGPQYSLAEVISVSVNSLIPKF